MRDWGHLKHKWCFEMFCQYVIHQQLDSPFPQQEWTLQWQTEITQLQQRAVFLKSKQWYRLHPPPHPLLTHTHTTPSQIIQPFSAALFAFAIWCFSKQLPGFVSLFHQLFVMWPSCHMCPVSSCLHQPWEILTTSLRIGVIVDVRFYSCS